jgi:hypothetical protein
MTDEVTEAAPQQIGEQEQPEQPEQPVTVDSHPLADEPALEEAEAVEEPAEDAAAAEVDAAPEAGADEQQAAGEEVPEGAEAADEEGSAKRKLDEAEAYEQPDAKKMNAGEARAPALLWLPKFEDLLAAPQPGQRCRRRTAR